MMTFLRTIDPSLRRTLLGFAVVIACILFFSCLAFSQPLDANHPELAWFSMETDHFIIHYTEESKRTALTIARIAEEIHPEITALYEYAPDTKFHFIVKDTDDYANGAAYYYNNKMLIWSTALDYDLRGTKNWLRMVITHEYTHIIQLGAARKLPRQVPALYLQVLGYEEEKRPDVLYGYPNILASYPFAMTIMPMWFAEGVAQYDVGDRFEYDFWDSHRDMQLRMRALDDQLLSLNEMEVFGKNSLGNEGVYNHGYSLVTYIAVTYGVQKLADLTDQMKRMKTITFDMAVQAVLGIPADTLHANWAAALKAQYLADTVAIRGHEIKGETFEEEGFGNFHPVYSPDGEKIYYLSNQGKDYLSLLTLYERAADGSGEAKKVVTTAEGPFDISPDGRWLLYSKIVRQGNESYYADLYLRDLERNKEARLTRSARAMEPAFSPDMTRIVFVVNHDGTKDIATLDLPEPSQWLKLKSLRVDQIKRLTDYGDGTRAFRPRFTPDGASILYSVSEDVGRDVMLMDADGSNSRILIGGAGDQRDPAISGDGEWVYYSDDSSGIFNLYRYNLKSGDTEPVTNLLGGAFQAAVAPDGSELIYSEWTLEGYKLRKFVLPQVPADEPTRYGRDYLAVLPEVTFNDSQPDTLPSRPYKPIFEQLFFVPRIAFDYGTFKPGVYIYSSDFLEKLSLFSGFDYNARGEFDAVAMLDFKALRPTLFAEGYYLKRIDDERFEDTFVIVGEREVLQPDGSTRLEPIYGDYGVDYRFHLMLFDLGAKFRLFTPLEMELRSSISRYDAFLAYDDGTSFQYTYFKGRFYQARFHYDGMPLQLKGNVHPRSGTEANLTVAFEDNLFIEGFEVNATALTLQEVFTPYQYWRFEGDISHWYNPFGELVLQPRLRAGYLDKQVDPFMHLYGGGLHGMRGYSFYSMGGTRKLIGSLALRHPIWAPDRPRFGWVHFDGLYGAVFGDVGDAWRETAFDSGRLKRDLGVELRAKFYSWYGYPTAVTFSAARGLDQVTVTENNMTTVYDPAWRYYVTVLFDFETIFPARGISRRIP